MRQGQQQNRQRSRGRGNNRNNNNRNQLNRSMESNGPDVRIRGTAAHIAEKYTQLARDAQTSGDTIAAESYWQFAEHYNRLIATAQAAQAEEQAKREEERAKRQEERAEARGDNRHDDAEDGDRDEKRGRGRNNRPRRDRDEATERDPAESPQPVVEADSAGDGAVSADESAGETGEETPKPRRGRRPRKADADAAPEGAELPAFISGAAE